MDEFANDVQERVKHILQNKAQYLEYIRIEQAELDKKAQIKFAEKKEKKKG